MYYHRYVEKEDAHGYYWAKHTRAGYVEHMNREGMRYGREPILPAERHSSQLPYGPDAEAKFDRIVICLEHYFLQYRRRRGSSYNNLRWYSC